MERVCLLRKHYQKIDPVETFKSNYQLLAATINLFLNSALVLINFAKYKNMKHNKLKYYNRVGHEKFPFFKKYNKKTGSQPSNKILGKVDFECFKIIFLSLSEMDTEPY